MQKRWTDFQLLGTALLAAHCALAATDDWSQLNKLPAGEVRVHQRTKAPTLAGTIDRVTEDALVLNSKSGQTAIERVDIIRVEWRPTDNDKLLPGISRRRQDPSIPKDRIDQRPNQEWIGSLKIDPKTGYKTIYSVDSKP